MERLIEYCLSKPGASKEYPFGPDPLVMKAGGKMFAVFGDDSISLKCEPMLAADLRDRHEAVVPGYHMNKKHWNTVYWNRDLDDEDLQGMIDHSYELVVAGLSKAARMKLSE
ncbi:MmcQ/YjbR family DNA-binding protein [Paenibacillus sp. NPDC058071]|uniref:MmcQ/YjbR family DNA-binding protein n=1 Tax=Paenibacillus sp. NPDC058071 TaxID=3346326 RepID=UPI0036DB91AB